MITLAALQAAASGNMENFIAASTPGGIEAQEKRGQLEQAEKQTLPVDLQDPQPQWEALGFVFGKRATGNEIFREVAFPAGWKKVPTDHSMWSNIVDDQGRKRGAIFYKAAFYDENAHARLSARFHVSKDYEIQEPTDTIRIFDACGLVDRKITGIQKPDWNDREKALEAVAQKDAALAELSAWLDAEYPDWRNPTAYWV